MSKNTYQNRKEKGLCVICGKVPAREGRVACKQCAKKQEDYQRKTREFRRNLGFCSRCGKNKLFGKEKECPECVAMMYESNRKSRERRNVAAMDYYKKDIARLKEQGLCRSCRKRRVAYGHTYCENCLVKHRKQNKEYRIRKEKNWLERSERPNYGLCYTCGKPLDRDGRICIKCAEKMTKNLPKTHDNKIWREDNKLLYVRK